jgi:hypothetical protein
MFEVGFKDVYPWVWSVMLGISLTLGERRGAFLPHGTSSNAEFWLKNLVALTINLGYPSVLFALTLVRLGPMYSRNMDFWQVMGALYLAAVPLGSHHLWLALANWRGWLPDQTLTTGERVARRHTSYGYLVWAFIAVLIPTVAVLFKWRVPW